MKLLLTLDSRDYTEQMPLYERVVVRAVICHEGRLLVQLGARGDYKIPGGGVDKGESNLAALHREVLEETGFCVLEDSVEEIGEVCEIREDIKKPGQKYVCHGLYYKCGIDPSSRNGLCLTESEKKAGYRPVWEYPDRIIEQNRKVLTKYWQVRDTEFLEHWRSTGYRKENI